MLERSDERTVFHCIANCELSSYTTMYPPERVVVSTSDIAKMCLWTKYRTRKAIKKLVEKGLIERASCGNPNVVSYGEYTELVCKSSPPTNGYALTKKGFQSEEWKDIYDMWCRSMEEWANGGDYPDLEEDEREREKMDNIDRGTGMVTGATPEEMKGEE